MKAMKQQLGAGLVELMVAMAIGTVIALGAGQLFLSTFSTFSAVGELSRKQEVAVFLTQILAEELRKEDDVDRYALSCSIADAQCLCTISDTDKG
ncbi:MAG: prepilin-type N-terminal cleavage/methylation domain-containing protein, partial [Pseudomonadota bacterium]|nr:prepilin-type N-terminal cleavage/methylation domain-containing protein [Pseudomonadota bacterium]